MSTRIAQIKARQILDSRGRPTVEVDVTLTGGARGRASVPSGASTGSHEAHELRDGDPQHYWGLGVSKAVANVNGDIARALSGADAIDQRALDDRLRALDGTSQLAHLGANAVLGVSLASCRAAALARGRPLYQHIAELAGISAMTLPVPMVNILSGGLHTRGGMDIQDFLAIPARATTIAQAIHTVSLVRSATAQVCQARGLPTLLADEGGLSPGCQSGRDALELLCEGITAAGLTPAKDILIAIDMAATSLYDPSGTYRFPHEGTTRTSDELIALMAQWAAEFPIVSIEDGLAEDDWDAWATLTGRLGDRMQLVGDDLFTTNPERLARGVQAGVANGVLVKFNQNGTLSGTLDVIAQARQQGYATIISARSGETEDPFMADLAVGTAAGQIKIGSLRTSSTLSKYNQLLRIEEESGAPYNGLRALAGRQNQP